jgi:hypothetical protein
MATDTYGHTYYSIESPFIKYFDRCRAVGMTNAEIKVNFPILKKYYKEMVTDCLPYNSGKSHNERSLESLFSNWVNDNTCSN